MIPSQTQYQKLPFYSLEGAFYCAHQLPKNLLCEKVLVTTLAPESVMGKLKFDRSHTTEDYWYAESVDELRAYGVL